jgi:hypothetical protein
MGIDVASSVTEMGERRPTGQSMTYLCSALSLILSIEGHEVEAGAEILAARYQ